MPNKPQTLSFEVSFVKQLQKGILQKFQKIFWLQGI